MMKESNQPTLTDRYKVHASTVARLLAQEGVNVTFENVPTACFNTQTRQLKLPVYTNLNQDAIDMLVAHEVGHALFTKVEKSDFEKVNHTVWNIVEDIRIERMMQDKYPGLAYTFKKGSEEVQKKDFMGIADRDISKMNLADRINIRAKLRNLVDVSFSPEEMPIVEAAFRAKTKDEVFEAANLLHKFIKDAKKKNDAPEKQDAPEGEASDECNSNEELGDGAESDSETIEDNGSLESDDKGEDSDESQDSTESNGDGEESQDSAESDKGNSEDSDESVEDDGTQSHAMGNENKTDEDSDGEAESGESSNADFDEDADDGDELISETQQNLDNKLEDEAETYTPSGADQFVDTYVVPKLKKFEYKTLDPKFGEEERDSYLAEFLKENDSYISMLVNEFNRKKAAYENAYATPGRTGKLDPLKLHSYRTNEDIFLSKINLAQAKSHGMIFFIDFSASMHGNIERVLKETLLMIEFCERVNIPYSVFSFTAGANQYIHKVNDQQDDLSRLGLAITCLINSKMSKSDRFNLKKFLLKIDRYRYDLQEYGLYLGNTPLLVSLYYSSYIIEEFKRNNPGVQRTNLIVLTDGDDNNRLMKRAENGTKIFSKKTVLPIGKKHVVFSHGEYELFGSEKTLEIQKGILDTIRSEYDVKIIGIYIGADYGNAAPWVNESYENIEAKLKTDNCISSKTYPGYDDYFFISTPSWKDERAALKKSIIPENSRNVNRITTAFGNSLKLKNKNKKFVRIFSDAIA